ncbi:MAG: H+-translocating transhydrogenase subunit beta, partial [Candidatus Binataceae bacterium]|nr:H+-translocating transhydrogenase subunit beta [Candidatus Binataceae bacterium]
MGEALQNPVIEIAYIVAVTLFVLSLKWLSSPATARRGVQAGEVGMLIAILATLLYRGIVSYEWIVIGLVVGSL